MSCRYLTLILTRDVRRFFWINTFFLATFVTMVALGNSNAYVPVGSILWGITLITANYVMINRFFISKAELLIREFKEKMLHAASFDELTRVYNRRAGMVRLREEFAGARRRKDKLTVAMIDIDNFKKLNDHYGHQAGDRVISQVAKTIKCGLRENDIVFRYGGEEFLAILPGSGECDAAQPLERLRKTVANLEIEFNDQTIKTSISIGIATIIDGEVAVVETVSRADKALYHAKASGRNRLIASSAMLGFSSHSVLAA